MFRRRKNKTPKAPRERKPREDRLFPRIFRFVSTVGVEAVVTRFLGPASKKPMGTATKLGGIAAFIGVVIAVLKGCG